MTGASSSALDRNWFNMLICCWQSTEHETKFWKSNELQSVDIYKNYSTLTLARFSIFFLARKLNWHWFQNVEFRNVFRTIKISNIPPLFEKFNYLRIWKFSVCDSSSVKKCLGNWKSCPSELFNQYNNLYLFQKTRKEYRKKYPWVLKFYQK